MLKAVVILIAFLISPMAQASDTLVVEFVRVVDGDTIIVNIDDWPAIVGYEIGVRVNGCDTPELRDKRPEIKALAYRAKDVVGCLLEKAKVVELRNIERGKYFRLVADVYVDGTNLTDFLIASELAQPYDGGTRPVW